MGLNVMGIAFDLTDCDIKSVAKKIGIQVSEKLSDSTFEDAISLNIESDDIFVTKTKFGTMILVGDDFPIFKVNLRKLSNEKTRVFRFVYGETTSVFFFSLTYDGRILRRKYEVEGEITHDQGKLFKFENSGETIENIISNMLLAIVGDNYFTLDPEEISFRYKYLGT